MTEASIDQRPSERPLYRPDDSKLEVLLAGRSAPLSIKPTTRLAEAVEQMLSHGYSQLPVVDPESRPIGLLTQQDVLRTFRHSGQLSSRLTARDAMRDIKPASPLLVRTSTTIWMVLDRFERHPAVLVTNDKGQLVDIVTDHDTSTWLRQRSADMVTVQDIEHTLRDLIGDAYSRKSDADLHADIARMMRKMWDDQVGNKVRSAIGRYLQGRVDNERCQPILDDLAEKADHSKFGLEDLTFAHYARLLLSEVPWARYEEHVSFEKGEFAEILRQINQTRNDLAHLRGVGDSMSRDRLLWFKDWLDRILVPLQKEDADDEASQPAQPQSLDEAATGNETPGHRELAASSDEADGGDGIYAADEAPEEDEARGAGDSRENGVPLAQLAAWLREQRREPGQRVTISFDRIDELLDEPLPAEAREHRSWWSNSAPHAESWLAEGYSVVGFFVSDQKVRFGKDRARERQYLQFFKDVAARLGDVEGISLDPKAYSWQGYDRVSARCGKGFYLIAAFNRGSRFRLHAEIDVQDAERNVAIFENLKAHKADIEKLIGAPLVWRLATDKRVCQVSLYAPGDHHITDSPDELSALVDWVIEYIGPFTYAMREYVPQA